MLCNNQLTEQEEEEEELPRERRERERETNFSSEFVGEKRTIGGRSRGMFFDARETCLSV